MATNPHKPHCLAGQVAVVTGAGRGIGQAISIALAGAGASVCCSARTRSEIDSTTSDIHRVGGSAQGVVADVTQFVDMQTVYSQAEETFGGVDIVFANAGISIGGTVEISDPEDWQAVLQTNLLGAYLTAKAAIPHLKKRRHGKIIFIGSGLGHRGTPDTSAYACSKAGVWMLTRTLASELLIHGICVNELIPGPVKTSITDQDDEQLLTQLGQDEWIKSPDDVVPLALFLASQPDSGPTGQSFSLTRRDC